MSDWVATLGQAVVGIVSGGVLMAVVNNIFNRAKNRVEVDAIAVTTATGLLTNMSQEVSRLHTRLTRAESELQDAEDYVEKVVAAVSSYRTRVDYLTNLVVAAGLPVEFWAPPPLTRIVHHE